MINDEQKSEASFNSQPQSPVQKEKIQQNYQNITSSNPRDITQMKQQQHQDLFSQLLDEDQIYYQQNNQNQQQVQDTRHFNFSDQYEEQKLQNIYSTPNKNKQYNAKKDYQGNNNFFQEDRSIFCIFKKEPCIDFDQQTIDFDEDNCQDAHKLLLSDNNYNSLQQNLENCNLAANNENKNNNQLNQNVQYNNSNTNQEDQKLFNNNNFNNSEKKKRGRRKGSSIKAIKKASFNQIFYQNKNQEDNTEKMDLETQKVQDTISENEKNSQNQEITQQIQINNPEELSESSEKKPIATNNNNNNNNNIINNQNLTPQIIDSQDSSKIKISLVINNNNNQISNTPPTSQLQGCNCKKSKCLKQYCLCFSKQGYCGPHCNCQDCLNKQETEEIRQQALQEALIRNPQAFMTISNNNAGRQQNNDESTEQNSSSPLKNKDITETIGYQNPELQQMIEKTQLEGSNLMIKGCNCKKTKCLKKYCECFYNGLQCNQYCKCIDCHNCDNPPQNTISNLKNNFIQNQQIQGNNYAGIFINNNSNQVNNNNNQQNDQQSTISTSTTVSSSQKQLQNYNQNSLANQFQDSRIDSDSDSSNTNDYTSSVSEQQNNQVLRKKSKSIKKHKVSFNMKNNMQEGTKVY